MSDKTGDFILESEGQWHTGANIGDGCIIKEYSSIVRDAPLLRASSRSPELIFVLLTRGDRPLDPPGSTARRTSGAAGVDQPGRRSCFGVRTKADARPRMPSITLRADSAAA
jgi:hypothetical protein